MSEYKFSRELAANIVFAEVRHFADHVGVHGYTDEEVQSLTRAIAYRIDADVNWTDVEELVQKRFELVAAQNGDHPQAEIGAAPEERGDLVVRVFSDLVYDIWVMVARVRPRWESTVHKALAA
jgi:hypothetical protein